MGERGEVQPAPQQKNPLLRPRRAQVAIPGRDHGGISLPPSSSLGPSLTDCTVSCCLALAVRAWDGAEAEGPLDKTRKHRSGSWRILSAWCSRNAEVQFPG